MGGGKCQIHYVDDVVVSLTITSDAPNVDKPSRGSATTAKAPPKFISIMIV